MQINIRTQFKIKLCKEKMLTRIICFIFRGSNIRHIDVATFQFGLYEEPIIISQVQSYQSSYSISGEMKLILSFFTEQSRISSSH